MKKEFEENGLDHFPDHKVLEMLLYYVIPRSDTNEIGHLLLRRFGSFSGVFDAPMDLLLETPGVGRETALYLKYLSEVFGRYLEDSQCTENIIDSPQAGKEFIQHKFLGSTIEKNYIVCLGANGKVLFADWISEGSPEMVEIRPMDIIRRALRTDAVSVVLAHNHPHGIALPSSADIAATNQLFQELKRVGIEFYDHLIVGNGDIFSMREQGLMPTPLY